MPTFVPGDRVTVPHPTDDDHRVAGVVVMSLRDLGVLVAVGHDDRPVCYHPADVVPASPVLVAPLSP